MASNKENIARRHRQNCRMAADAMGRRRGQRIHPAVKEELAGLAAASARMGRPWNEPDYTAPEPGTDSEPLPPARAHILPIGIFTVGGGKYGWELRVKAKVDGVTMGIMGSRGVGQFAEIPHKAARALAHYLLARCPSDTKKRK